MIEYVSTVAGGEAFACPVFICDACGKQMVKGADPDPSASGGLVCWGRRDFGDDLPQPVEQTPLFFCHRGDCWAKLEAWYDANYYRTGKGWSSLSSIYMGEFVKALLHNLEHPISDGGYEKIHPHRTANVVPDLVPKMVTGDTQHLLPWQRRQAREVIERQASHATGEGK